MLREYGVIEYNAGDNLKFQRSEGTFNVWSVTFEEGSHPSLILWGSNGTGNAANSMIQNRSKKYTDLQLVKIIYIEHIYTQILLNNYKWIEEVQSEDKKSDARVE